MKDLKRIFTDFNGYKYYLNPQGRMVNKNGFQVSISEEYHVNQILTHEKEVRDSRQKRIHGDVKAFNQKLEKSLTPKR